MSGSPGPVEDEARRLAQALSNLTHDDGPRCAPESASEEPAVTWLREHGPGLLRSVADTLALGAEGLRVLADGLDQASAGDRPGSAGTVPAARAGDRSPFPSRAPGPVGGETGHDDRPREDDRFQEQESA